MSRTVSSFAECVVCSTCHLLFEGRQDGAVERGRLPGAQSGPE